MATCTSWSISAEDDVPAPSSFSRLPNSTIPKHYSIWLKPDFNRDSFDGETSVQLDIKEKCSQLILNASELAFSIVDWEDGPTKNIQKPHRIWLEEKKEQVIFSFNPPLPIGTGTLTMKYIGLFNKTKQRGFFYNIYFGPRGDQRLILATHFEPTDARRCFPCWDEPAFKSTFDITLIADKSKVVLSNMPVKTTSVYDVLNRTFQFERTPPMSTYLVAFAIGDFESVEQKSSSGILTRIYTTEGKTRQADFALRVAIKLLNFYKEYFGFGYPLPKLDFLALPYFSQGGMENWGLITFKESSLLVYDKLTSVRAKQTLLQSIAHELAHQWFGNLVTMEWWDDMWLKESVALFLEFFAVSETCYGYELWPQFTTNTMIKALELDSLESSHPVSVLVDDPAQIPERFDRLSYIKGASLIRMLHNYVTDERFREGFSLYFIRHQFQNATAEDFWDALEEISSKPVKAMMATWTNQKGFPLLKIHYDHAAGDNSRTFTITQEKFCAHPNSSEPKSERDSFRWMIPISFASSQNPIETCHNVVMDGTEALSINFEITGINKNDWVKVNFGLQGFFRVHYPANILAEFVLAIEDKTMEPLDRLGLIDDLFAMVKKSDLSTVDMLRFMRAYMLEDDFNVWFGIDNIVDSINTLLSFTDLHFKFQNYAKREIFKDIEESIGWNEKMAEGQSANLLRVQVLARMVSLGSEKTIRHAKEMFKNRNEKGNGINPNLRSVVYRAILKSGSGSSEALESLLTMYQKTTFEDERLRILRALGSVTTPNLMEKILQFAMSDEVEPIDILPVILGMCNTKPGIEFAWDFFKEHHQLFRERFPIGQTFIRLVKILTWNFATEEMALEIAQFFKKHRVNFEGMDQTIQQIVENIRVNVEWIKRDETSLRTFLTKV